MTAAIVALVRLFWKPLLVVAFVALIAGVFAGQRHEINRWKAKYTAQQAQVVSYKLAVSAQNDAIQRYVDAGKKAQSALDDAMQRADTASAQIVTQFRTKYVPVKVPVQCELAAAAGAVNAAQIGALFGGAP